MLKYFGLLSLLFSNLVLAGAGGKPVLVCTGKLETDSYALRVLRVTSLTGGRAGSYIATLEKNGKISKVANVTPFDKGFSGDYGYQNKQKGLNVSIPHVQLTDIPTPYARGVVQIWLSDAWLNIRVLCNTQPVQ